MCPVNVLPMCPVRTDEALIYLSNAGQGKRTNIKLAANDLLIFSATLGGRSEIIERLDRDTNSMLSKSTLSKLVAGDCKGFEMAVADLTTSSKGNLITRSLQYVEFLSRWVAMNCASNSGYFETQLLTLALGGSLNWSRLRKLGHLKS